MRIAICNWKDRAHPAAGGAETFVHQVARRWVAAGHEVRLLTAAAGRGPARSVVDGVEVWRSGGRFGVYRDVRARLGAEVEDWADVLVDSINTRPFLDPRRHRTPVLGLAYQVCREIWFDEMPLPVAVVGRFVLEPLWLARYRDAPVATISQSSAASLRGYGIRNVQVIPMAASVADPGPVAKSAAPTALFVGRLSANKRPEVAVRAFARACEVVPGARLDVVGEGPLRERLERDAPQGVRFLGRVDEVAKARAMKAADVLLVSSRREGWGLVVTEAAALGTPSVAFDVPGLRDSVTASGMGVLVEPTEEALAAGVATALRERPRPAPVTPPSWDNTAGALLELVDRLVRAAA